MKILPTLICLMTCVGMLKASGALEQIVGALKPVLSIIGVSPDIVPLALMRPVSGSGALCIYNDILKSNGADSNTARMASVLFGSTETTLYAIAVYFGAINIKKTRHTLPCALSADLMSFLMSSLTIYIFFG
ncbi:MAG: spore maturation protein [Oscillospiraceae bacterium]